MISCYGMNRSGGCSLTISRRNYCDLFVFAGVWHGCCHRWQSPPLPRRWGYWWWWSSMSWFQQILSREEQSRILSGMRKIIIIIPPSFLNLGMKKTENFWFFYSFFSRSSDLTTTNVCHPFVCPSVHNQMVKPSLNQSYH